jgi:hypothetical protein
VFLNVYVYLLVCMFKCVFLNVYVYLFACMFKCVCLYLSVLVCACVCISGTCVEGFLYVIQPLLAQKDVLQAQISFFFLPVPPPLALNCNLIYSTFI